MPVFWRRVLYALVILGGLYWYAASYGLFVGLPPFLPVLVWDYTGEHTYDLILRGTDDAIKIKLKGELQRGSLEVWITNKAGRRLTLPRRFKDTFQGVVKKRLDPGRYTIHFGFKGARGWARLDWVSTKFEHW